MAKRKSQARREAVVAEEDAPVVPEGDVAVEAEPTGAHVTVTYNGGTRVYSKEVHGKDYKALAKEFADKFNGRVA